MLTISPLNEKQPNYFHKLLGIKVKQNALIEIYNLILNHREDILSLSYSEISQISNKYSIHLQKSFRKERMQIYHRFLKHCVSKPRINERSVEELKHLSVLLELNELDCREALKNICTENYLKKVGKIIESGKIDGYEQENIEFIKNKLFGEDE